MRQFDLFKKSEKNKLCFEVDHEMNGCILNAPFGEKEIIHFEEVYQNQEINIVSPLNNTKNKNITNVSIHSLHTETKKEEQIKTHNKFTESSSDSKNKQLKVKSQKEQDNNINNIIQNQKVKNVSEVDDNKSKSNIQKEMINARKVVFNIKIEPKILFCYKNLHKGRVSKKRKDVVLKSRKYHSKFTKDNILRKIKVMFHSFLLEFINKIIEIFFPSNFESLKLKKINRDITQDVSIEKTKKLFHLKLWEFFSLQEGITYKKKRNNKDKLLYMMEKREGIKNILEMSYIHAYNELFVNADSNILPKEFEEALTNSNHLTKGIQKMEMEESRYIKELELCARKEFQPYYLYKKSRQKKDEKTKKSE